MVLHPSRVKVSEETVKIELHTIATYDGKEYELEELMNGMFKRNAELHSIIKEVREKLLCYGETFDLKVHQEMQKELLEILDKDSDKDEN